MIMKFLGTGAAFSLNNYQSNMVIEDRGKRLLVDAGGDVRHSLRDAGLSYKDIDAVYITHLHNDHIGGMEFLAFSTFFDPACSKLPLYCHKWLLDDLWSQSLKGGLASVQGMILSLDDYFDVHRLVEHESFAWQSLEIRILQSVHVYNGYAVVPTFGLFIRDPNSGKNIYHTSDTQLVSQYLDNEYQEADIIIQDCETGAFKTGVHAHYEELVSLDLETKSKMHLWHYQDNVVEELDRWQEKAHNDGFAGFLTQGQQMEL